MTDPIGAATKTSTEIKRYKIDYTDWLDIGETVTAVTYTALGSAPLITVSGATINAGGLGVTFFINGGLDSYSYELKVEITTSGGQVKDDYIQVAVNDIPTT
jgi:hypothetical protein